jgi:acyl-CoA thioesterase FadM
VNALTPLAEWNVPQDEIDHLGHMSTLFYAQRAEQGVARIVEQLGGAPGELAAAGLIAAVVDQHTHFRREQLAGAPLTLAGGVVAQSAERIDLYQEMANAGTGEAAAMFRSGVQLRHRATRLPASIPAPWLEAAAARPIEPPARSRPRSLPLERMGADLTLDDFARAGIASHQRREITAEICDADGFLAPAPPRLVGAKGPYNQGVMDQVWGAAAGFVWPALEMRTLSPRAARQGDVLDVYTALLSVSHKIIHSGIWVFEARSSALVSVSHQVNIFFKLSTRRPQDMPADLRERLTGLAHPELLPPRAQAGSDD